MFTDKKELRSVYYLAITCLVLLVITIFTKEIAWGVGVAIPLFLVFIGFDNKISNILKKLLKNTKTERKF